MQRHPLGCLVLLAAILLLPGCRDEAQPFQPTTSVDQSPALVAVSNSWTVKAPMPTTRFWHTAGVANDAGGQPRLYVFGGTDGENDGFGTVDAYNPATDTWATQPLSQMVVDEVIFFNGAGRIGNKLYLSGGSVETGDGNGNIRVLQVYDPERNTWTRKADMPRGSSGGVSGVIDGKLYVLPGVETVDEACEGCGAQRTRRFYRYNPATNTWTQLASCPSSHDRAMAGVIDGKFFVAGGSTDKLDIYNPVTNRWSSGASLPSPRSLGGGAVLGAKLYVIGGYSAAGRADEVLAYNPTTNQWTTKAPLPAARTGLAAAKIMIAGRPHIVALGGYAILGENFGHETDVYAP